MAVDEGVLVVGWRDMEVGMAWQLAWHEVICVC